MPSLSRDRPVTLFFLLSGEHPTLPLSELKSILEAEGYRYRILETLVQAPRMEVDVASVKVIESRAAMTKVCSLELFTCEATSAEIFRKMRETSLEGFLKGGESFVVRVQRVRGAAPQLLGVELERKLGEAILDKIGGVKVKLEGPQKTFFGILTENRFLLGLKMAEISPRPFVDRKPRRRPFFHPSSMPAKLARCMVNLAQSKAGDLVLDPFCGTASILVEAGLIGCRVVGLDAQRHMTKGSLRNLLYYGVKPQGMITADARLLPLTKVDCVVTDPPYGRSATTLGWSPKKIVEDFLSKVGDLLPRDGRICIASPKSIKVGEIGKSLGFKHVESHYAYVHRSLTREIAVFKRK
ncbi:MAG: DNA methyltransferase [Candidatus Bathyarchaeia archaeon]